MVNFLSDPLLRTDKLFIGNKLNLYSALVKAEDFKSPGKLKSILYCFSPEFKDFINNLQDEYKHSNFLFLRLLHEEYANDSAFSRVKSFRRWYETSTFPLSFIRAVCLFFCDNNRMLDFLHSDMTDSHHINKIRFPSNKNELLKPDLIYLCGCITGDGFIKKDTLIKIVDGHSSETEIIHSKMFLENISKIIDDIFHYEIKSIKRKKNLYEIHIISKWIVRFLNYFYEIPYSPKKGIVWPKMIIGNEKFYLRGLFDTDGGMHKDSKFIMFKSASKGFIDNVRGCTIKFGFTPGKLRFDKNGAYYFPIYAHDLKRFSNIIGFNHPRKKQYLISHLRKGAADKTFHGIKKRNVENDFLDLILISNFRILDMGNYIKDVRKDRGLTQNEFAKELKIKRRNFTRYENNMLAIPIKLLISILGSKKTLYHLISETNPRFGLGGHNFVRFPIDISKMNFQIYKYLSPTKNSVIIRKRYKGYILDERQVQIIIKKIENYFDTIVTISKGKSEDIIILSKTLALLLDTFFIYAPPWEPVR